MSQLNVSYRDSPLSVDGTPRRHGGPRAGDRLPDQLVSCAGRSIRLHELSQHRASLEQAFMELTADSVEYQASVQNTAEWLELFIVSFYSLYLAHIVAHALHFSEWYESYGILTVAVLTAATLAIGIRPWAVHHGGDSHGHGASRLPAAMSHCVRYVR